MIRPEAKDQLLKWREVLVGVAAFLLGLWWLLGPGQLLTFPALVLMTGGAALIWIGIQRARFRSAGAGPGTVQVDEGQIIYFGPLTGGAVALRELVRLSIDGSVYPVHWRLEQPGQPVLLIPVNASGADALFDAFSTLPGLRTERMLSLLEAPGTASTVVWLKDTKISAQVSSH